MNDLTRLFAQSYVPVKGLIFYEQADNEKNCYVESYDFNSRGRMINAHPLSVGECKKLAGSLNASKELSSNFLRPKGLLPARVIYLRGGSNAYAIWHTPPTVRKLYFTRDLGLNDEVYPLPAMLWKADRDNLWVYALGTAKKISLRSKLYRAPFFNVHDDGRVCMGNVDVDIDQNTGLEEFIQSWQDYFFNSKFSHVIGGAAPVNGNIIQVWKSLAGGKKFHPEHLVEHTKAIQNLLS